MSTLEIQHAPVQVTAPPQPRQASLAFPHELIVDNFAGGGGTSEGLEQAFGRPVDIAINHDPEALAMHAINHPHTRHLCESVWDVDPIQVTGNQPVALVWLSPDCKHFSKAKGATPVSKNIRGLAWVGMRWVALTKPRVLMLENVEEFQDWGPLMQVERDGEQVWMPDPSKRGVTFQSFVRQLERHGYKVEWQERRACDDGAPTIRKRLFLIARRDGLPIVWPEAVAGEPMSRAVLAGKLQPYRTAAECIDFTLPAQSVFGRPRELARNTLRRVAKGLWRHVLTSPKPFIVGAGGPSHSGKPVPVDQPLGSVLAENHRQLAQPVLAPFLNEHANASNQRTMPADEPLRTVCAQVKGGHFSLVSPELQPMVLTNTSGHPGAPVGRPLATVTTGGHHALVAPVIAPLRGTEESHLAGDSVEAPLSTISAGGTHHALAGACMVTMGYGERPGQDARTRDMQEPLTTITAGGVKAAVAAVHLTHLTHHGERAGYSLDEPIKTVTGANRGEQALVAACMEQANGGFYDGDGRPADAPFSTVTSSGAQQRLVTAYCIKYYSNGGQWQGLEDPMHTVPTKGRMGLVKTVHVPAAVLTDEQRHRAKSCADLLHEHLPDEFPEAADMVLVYQRGQWWVLVDITLRMLKPRELFNAQGFRSNYIINEIPNPALLFVNGQQVADPLTVPRIPLSATAQVRMCGNSVSPYQSMRLAQANFRHEAQIYGRVAA